MFSFETKQYTAATGQPNPGREAEEEQEEAGGGGGGGGRGRGGGGVVAAVVGVDAVVAVVVDAVVAAGVLPVVAVVVDTFVVVVVGAVDVVSCRESRLVFSGFAFRGFSGLAPKLDFGFGPSVFRVSPRIWISGLTPSIFGFQTDFRVEP